MTIQKILTILSISLFIASGEKVVACTNLIVGRGASVDGSVIVSYNADSYGCYGIMQHFAAGKHPKGSMRKVFDWESDRFLGEIEEVEETYNVVGNINEHQLCIGETTFGGRTELVDTAGIIDYGSLIYIALQRCKTAREAIQTMTDLVNKYGYASEGETFTIADKQEVWIMEMIGKGPKEKGTVWVAVRVPDDCISGHANQSRIRKISQYDAENCLHSKDVISFARKQGYFKGKDADFDFAAAYCPPDFSGLRICEARVWSFFRDWADDMDKYEDFVSGYNLQAEPMPLYVKPRKKLSVQDVQQGMRNHFEGTKFSMTEDAGAGHYESPYRPRPLFWELDGKKYYNERPIATQQSSFTFVAQMRSNLPDAVGGVIWFGNDDANMVAYTPVYCCSTEAPACYTKKFGDDVTFSLKSAFWVENWVANMVYPKYWLMMPDLKKVRDELEKEYFENQNSVEQKAQQLLATSKTEAVKFLTDFSVKTADNMLERWIKLGEFLIVKYNDFVVKPEKDGHFERTREGLGAPVKSVGYPESTRRRIVKETGDRFLVPEAKK